MDDGREVVVLPSGNTRMVKGEEFFIPPAYVEVLLEGGFQVVRKARIKTAPYGSPFEGLRR
jgi:hypothetical protein